MLRSHSQVLYSYLPGAVFRHEDQVYGRVVTIGGDRLTDLNDAVIFDEIATYLERWPEEDRHDLPLPRDMRVQEYRLIRPERVKWELWPLTFECARPSCRLVRTFRDADQLAKSSRCKACGGPLQQLRFYNAHRCGQTKQMFVPKCATHGYEHLFFENTGTFRTATWRCRGAGCNGGVVQRTNQSPCDCGDRWKPVEDVVRMRAHTLDDTRAYRAHYIDLINIDSSTFQTYQRHPSRGQIAVAHYLGLIDGLKEGMNDADTHTTSARATPEEWAAKEATYRALPLGEEEIAALRRQFGPADTGLAGTAGLPAAVLETVAGQRTFYERAAVFDRNEVPRMSLAEQLDRARERGQTLQADAMQAAADLAGRMAIAELAVTWEFPIAKVAFGYTREQHDPGQGAIRGFRRQGEHDGKYPVYAVASSTEALLVTLSAREVLTFLHQRGEVAHAPSTEDDARRQLLEIFADEAANVVAAGTIRVLVHTLAHLLLRGLDDGQIGFAEASLAEWLVPETLTFAIYANTLKDFTLGSLWTLLNDRALTWLRSVVDRSIRCENDPICYQHDPRSCERCAYITFGCRLFNAALDRKVLYDFLLARGILADARP